MGFNFSGLDKKIKSTKIEIDVNKDEGLVQLANALDWNEIVNMIIGDLKTTTKKLLWWLGRKLVLRIHLGIFILQTYTKLTDRGIENAVRHNALYQVFCGKSIVKKWHCPDHTKIEKFRNRIKPETQQKIVSYIAKLASDRGFADPSKMDIDSTVQEANMTYPSDAKLLTKLGCMCKKVVDYFKNMNITGIFNNIDLDIKKIKKISKDYFFLAKNTKKEKRNDAFKNLYNIVKKETKNIIEICRLHIGENILKKLPWNIKRTVEQIKTHAKKYLDDVDYFIKNQTMKSGKILSFHLHDVACIVKGKIGKDKEFGRVFQIGRLGGNYLIVLQSTSVRQEDKKSLIPMVNEHEIIFGEKILKSCGSDKGYYSTCNVKALENRIEELAIQIPGNVKKQIDINQELINRRAGIEPLIGHVKKYGLEKSKMKSDESTLASGYRAVLGFNLNQLTRDLIKSG